MNRIYEYNITYEKGTIEQKSLNQEQIKQVSKLENINPKKISKMSKILIRKFKKYNNFSLLLNMVSLITFSHMKENQTK